ncbi:MAG: Bug family tripartite tricarboxylate transporter substrate binding protein [Betaproteobacteria bacterium]
MHALIWLFASIALWTGSGVGAQEYPTRPIRLLIPQSTGGAQDTTARILTATLTDRLGWRFVVDNRPGGNGFIGVSIAAKGTPDGYTMLMAHTGEFAVNPAIFPNVPYDLERDFTPVTMVTDAPLLLIASPKIQITSFQSLVAMAKAKPGQIAYSSAGTGTINHLAGEWLAHAAGVKLIHVPYKGGAAAATAVVTGDVAVGIASVAGSIAHVQGGRVRVIGVTTAKRMRAWPDWPTAQEAGISGVDASIWVGLFAPKAVPQPIISRLNTEVRRMLELPEVRARYAESGSETAGMTPAAFSERIRKDLERYRAIVKASGITPE